MRITVLVLLSLLLTACGKSPLTTQELYYPGNSGSMAINQEGEVVGVFNSTSSNTNYSNIVPLEDLKNFLSKI